MDKQLLLQMLRELDAALASSHEIVLIGGAAMILHFGAIRATCDIDAIFVKGDSTALRSAIRVVGQRHQLPKIG